MPEPRYVELELEVPVSRLLRPIEPSPHVLDIDRRRQIRAAIARELDPRPRDDFVMSKAYEDYCNFHLSNGMPVEGTREFDRRVAMFHTGFTSCALCDQPTDGEDLCPLHLYAVEPYRDDPAERSHRSFDAKKEPG